MVSSYEAGKDEEARIDGDDWRQRLKKAVDPEAWRRPHSSWTLQTWSTTGKRTSEFLGRGELGVREDDENHGGSYSVAHGRDEGEQRKRILLWHDTQGVTNLLHYKKSRPEI
ncbi:hypothetical protein TRIUR3_33538 [Triticum urartu]|uniref:Uncharacterized protein n=1 Tax=Triticum urartu TaxID=4572 RepID=M7ZZN2_TRIUA|nr:hypothetical protein TRIUR3_33538 [Triticum urartu]